jgi:hypothetical protein
MAVPADSTPYYVDGAFGRFNGVPGTVNGWQGPFAKPAASGVLFGVVENSWSSPAPTPLPPPPAQSFSFYKTTNAGKNWARVVSKTYNSGLDVFYPGSGTLVYCAFCNTPLPLPANPTDDVKLVTFDMATETFGSVITGGPTAWFGIVLGDAIFKLFRLTTGDLILIYMQPTTLGGSDTKLYWAQSSGGVWTSVDNLLNDSGTSNIGTGAYLIDNCFIDPHDRIHIFGVAGKSGGYPDWFYTNLKSGVQSAVQVIYTSPTFASYPTRVSPGVYYSADDSFEVGFAESVVDGDAFTRISLLRGAPSAAPVFDPLVAVSPTLTYPLSYGSPKLLTNVAKTVRYMLWPRGVTGGRPVIDYSANSGGGWDTPVTYYGQTVSMGVPAPPALSIQGPASAQPFFANFLDNTPRFGLWTMLAVRFDDLTYSGNAYVYVDNPSVDPVNTKPLCL